jgi:hypothetical protein
MLTHEPFDPITAHRHALALERQPGASVTVTAVVGLVDALDLAEQSFVLDCSPGAGTGSALVVGGRRHAQGPADRLDAETTAVLLDKRGHFGRSASSSVAKNTDAALRISFARRNS